jgi:dolichol-phosphate mannosyltransferase
LKKAVDAQDQRMIAADGFACMVDILLRLSRENAIFGEVPLVLRYDQKRGASKMKVGSTIVRTLMVLARERFRRTPRESS